MVANSKEVRGRAQERLDRAARTSNEAKALIDAEGQAHRAKTARLKAERLAKEAAEAPPPVKAKAVRKKRATPA